MNIVRIAISFLFLLSSVSATAQSVIDIDHNIANIKLSNLGPTNPDSVADASVNRVQISASAKGSVASLKYNLKQSNDNSLWLLFSTPIQKGETGVDDFDLDSTGTTVEFFWGREVLKNENASSALTRKSDAATISALSESDSALIAAIRKSDPTLLRDLKLDADIKGDFRFLSDDDMLSVVGSLTEKERLNVLSELSLEEKREIYDDLSYEERSEIWIASSNAYIDAAKEASSWLWGLTAKTTTTDYKYFSGSNLETSQSSKEGFGAGLYGLYASSSDWSFAAKIEAERKYKAGKAEVRCNTEPASDQAFISCISSQAGAPREITEKKATITYRTKYKNFAFSPEVSHEFEESVSRLELPVYLLQSFDEKKQEYSGFTGGLSLSWTDEKDLAGEEIGTQFNIFIGSTFSLIGVP